MKTSTNTVMLMALMVLTVSPALAILLGPMYPPPGGVTWAPSGTDPGDPNGFNWHYTNFNFVTGNISNLYWSPLEDIIAITLNDATGGERSFAATEILQLVTDPNGASAVWTGSSLLTYKLDTNDPWIFNEVVETRYTVTLSGNASWIDPGLLPAELEGYNGAVAHITGNFTANLFAEANFPSYGWMPINEGFNMLETLGFTASNFGTGFWSEPYTGFTYQGRLLADNVAADGLYDMQFMLYNDPNTLLSNQVGSAILADDIEVMDGYFIAELDFGTNAFNDRARWLQIAVRPGTSTDPEDFVALVPPQPLTTTPYALNSLQTRGIFVASNSNVGIGTTSPTEQLEVNGTIKATAFAGDITAIETDPQVGTINTGSVPLWNGSALVTGTITDNGNVGIGTASPMQKLDVEGDIRLTSRLTFDTANAYSGNDAIIGLDAGSNKRIVFYDYSSGLELMNVEGGTANLNVAGSVTADSFIGDGSSLTNLPAVAVEEDPQVGMINTNAVPVWNGSALVTGTVYDNGNIGIGTTDPNATLDVAGNIKTAGIYETPSGNVGIATTEPNATLDVNGTVKIGAWHDQSLGTNGYAWVGSVLFQWGTEQSTSDDLQTFNFPIAFPNQCFSITVNRQTENTSSPLVTHTWDTTGFSINREGGIDGTPYFNYIAIGH